MQAVDIEIGVPKCEPGLGKNIRAVDSPDLIEGVRIEPVRLWPDDRGYFLEVFRTGHGLLAEYPSGTTQVSAAYSYPGAIKAFHYHRRQTDCFTPALGQFQIALVDLRKDSRTFGLKNTIYAGALRPWQILIPRGVGHGYKILGTEPGLLIYATDHFYDPQDEGRIPHDDSSINYAWEIQFK